MQSCLVVLAFYAKITQDDGTERIIPIWTNHFRNSRLGVKPCRLHFGVETTQSNIDEGERLKKEKEFAEANPYIHKIDETRSVAIHYLGFITMVFIYIS